MRGLSLISAGLVTFSLAAPALAFVDVQVEHGRRWLSTETDGDKSSAAFQQTTVGGHLSPLPIVSFGLTASLFDITAHDKDAADAKTYDGYEVGLDVQAALGFVPVVTPFARFNLPLASKYSLTSKDGSVEVETVAVPLQTYWMSAGAQFSIIPLLSVMAEIGTGVYMAKIDKYEIDNVDVLHTDDSLNNRKASKMDTFLMGLQLSF